MSEVRAVLGPLLEALIQINCAYLRRHPETPRLARAGVVYKREAPGLEEARGVAHDPLDAPGVREAARRDDDGPGRPTPMGAHGLRAQYAPSPARTTRTVLKRM